MAYRKIDQYDHDTTEQIDSHIKAILGLLGEDVEREGLHKTPERVAKAMWHTFPMARKPATNS